MARYHINEEGKPGLCSAVVTCPFGTEDAHYKSLEQARAAYEATMGEQAISRVRKVQLPETARTFTMAPDPTDPKFPGRVEPTHRSWDVEDSTYAPPSYVTPKIAKRINAGGSKNVDPNWHGKWETEVQWADGKTPRMRDSLPLNPAGRTGLTGLGGCKQLGENKAADPIITRVGPNGKLQVLLGYKEVEDQWAIPGGSVDEGEDPATACSRELLEEVGLEVDMSKGPIVYQGFVDDHRNTDNAWFSTQARHVHLTGPAAEQEPDASDDISAAQWISIEELKPEKLFASHGQLLTTAGLFKTQA